MVSTTRSLKRKIKLDIESIFYYDDSFYMFGSASSSLQNRENLFVYNPKTDQVTTTNLSAQFQSIREKINIDNTDFNIEGSFIYKGNYYLLNRGNGKNGRNGIIITDTDFENVPKFVNISLPVDNQYASFTDGIVVENSIYFLAAIEETTSTYDDGAIGGSFFGKINLKTLKLEKFEKISNTNKFEGLAFYKKDKKTTQFLLCEDPDNNSQESTIYKLTINK